MPTLSDIKRRIRAVKNTQQITKAMKMVAAAKLRRAQERMMQLRPYAERMNSVISNLAAVADLDVNPLLARRSPSVVEVLVVTSDRGLCGAFNTNILRRADALVQELGREQADTVSGRPLQVNLTTVGKKAIGYFKRRNRDIRKSWSGISGKLEYLDVQEISLELIERYRNAEVDGVYVVYNRFRNVAIQKVTVSQILPVEPPEEGDAPEPRSDYIYEPTEQELFEKLLPKNVEIQVYRALLESKASEEAARMTAMENATKSASDMIEGLTLQYNKARQASITAELMDIVGGVEALK